MVESAEVHEHDLGRCSDATDHASSGSSRVTANGEDRNRVTEQPGHPGIGHHFGITLTDDYVRFTKPDPERSSRCAASPGRPVHRADDRRHLFDMEMGRRAGTTTCDVTWGHQPDPELVAAEPDHLVDASRP